MAEGLPEDIRHECHADVISGYVHGNLKIRFHNDMYIHGSKSNAYTMYTYFTYVYVTYVRLAN